MTDHKTGTHAEWLAARLELPEAEKAPPGRNESGFWWCRHDEYGAR